MRVQLFLKHVLEPKFGIVDVWLRYEWQGRDSVHAHVILWLANASGPNALATPALWDGFATVWGAHITVVKPCFDLRPPIPGERPPMQANDD
jgi:hypothetical protein